MRIVFASRNRGKVGEARALLAGVGVELLALGDFPNVPDILEDGRSFYENALKKARTTALATGEITLADDSGLEVDFLKGAPGIFSARYAESGNSQGGEEQDAANISKLLEELRFARKEERQARFVCCLVLYKSESDITSFEGKLEGTICFERIGNNGFGYDPVFYVPDLGGTVAQLSLDEKNKVSHRAAAFYALRRYLLENGA